MSSNAVVIGGCNNSHPWQADRAVPDRVCFKGAWGVGLAVGCGVGSYLQNAVGTVKAGEGEDDGIAGDQVGAGDKVFKRDRRGFPSHFWDEGTNDRLVTA